MRPRSETPTPQELEVMKVVWERGEATVRDVYETLRERRRVAYTTVMTVMGVLEKKGHLKRRTEGRSYVYRPAQPQRRVVKAMVQDFLTRVFDGSAQPLLAHLVEERDLSAADLQRLVRRVREGK